MRRTSYRSIQFLALIACISVQICLILWQYNVCSIEPKTPGNPQEPTKPTQHDDARWSQDNDHPSMNENLNNRRKNEIIHSLMSPLPLSASHVRVFPRHNKSFPCYKAEDDWDTLARQQSPAANGFLYVKARKAGSSSVASVAIRIARNMARRVGVDTPVCRVRFNHPMASRLKYSIRDKANSFLWSVLREPTRRFVSEFFHFGVSRNFIQPTDDNIRAYMRDTTPSINNYYLRWLSVERPFNYHDDHSRIPAVVQSIINEYDFLGITERLDESLIALQMILNLEISDILYLSAKLNGGWDDGVYRNKCYYIIPSFLSYSIKKYFRESEEWYNFTVGDTMLYRAVNASLDATIANLGRAAFDKNLRIYRWALDKVEKTCRGNTTLPCSASGQRNLVNDCLVWDSGCGMECIDSVVKDMEL